MLKQLVVRTSMSYTSEDFRETVDEFIAGEVLDATFARRFC